MDERFREHLEHPWSRGPAPEGACDGAAGGAACGDLVRLSVRVRGDRVDAVSFDASGCGAAQAAGSATCALVDGALVVDAARVGAAAIAEELGGLSPGKLHAAELAADALARALGNAVRAGGAAARVDGRTLVAMSGGVDSAVAALLCARAGGDVIAVTLELWRDPDNDGERSCCSADAVRHARALAHRMGLPHLTLDLRDEFRAGVVEPWVEAHRAGETPNPCVGCNGHVRLDAMVDYADALGAEVLATGHYARLDASGLLRAAADPAKDQSYMLAALRPSTLARLRFPLGERTKPQVRALAAEADLPVAQTPDSQDLCFLAGTGQAAFLARHGGLADVPGEVVAEDGTVLGVHQGAHRFTVGQRKGLPGSGGGTPLYVLRTEGTRVVAGPRERLATDRVALRGARLHRPAAEVDAVKLRYRSHPLRCTVAAHDGRRAELTLLDPAEGGAAPGQTAVLLAGDVVVGHGTITRA